MRLQLLWNHVPLPATLRLVWDRITFSRLTFAYFVFSLIHFILQILFQIKAFTVNAEAASFLNSIVFQGEATNDGLPFLRGSSLFMCDWVPGNLSLDDAGCHVVWNGTKGINVIGTQAAAAASVPATYSIDLATTTSTSLSVTVSSTLSAAQLEATVSPSTSPGTITIFFLPVPTSVTDLADDGHPSHDGSEDQVFTRRTDDEIMTILADGQSQVQISGMGFSNTSAILDRSCLLALNWPVSVLDNTKREDIVFVAFQLWVLGVSTVALLNESIPHVLASLVTHVMAAAWTGFQITSTASFRSDFNRVVTNGACNGISLLPGYWRDRGEAEIPSLALNACALLVSCFLTWKLIKLFGWQTFKRVGASLTIHRVYQIVLVLSITIQLCLFFIIVTVSLWLDLLWNSAIGDRADFQKLYKITSIITLVLTVPWLTTGWIGSRRELRFPMFIFLLLSCLYLGGWSVMFFATTFRWTFVTWRFFSVMACASVSLTVASFILGVVCRLNFGRGLLRYLSTHQGLSSDDIYYRGSDIEKVEFPSNQKLIPTHSVAFGSGLDDPLPNQRFVTRGPRFFNRLAQPFETISRPQAACLLTRHVFDGSSQSHQLVRSDSLSSDGSFRSVVGYYSYSYHDSERPRTDIPQER